jgi:hypothetical protein
LYYRTTDGQEWYERYLRSEASAHAEHIVEQPNYARIPWRSTRRRKSRSRWRSSDEEHPQHTAVILLRTAEDDAGNPLPDRATVYIYPKPGMTIETMFWAAREMGRAFDKVNEDPVIEATPNALVLSRVPNGIAEEVVQSWLLAVKAN